MSEQAGMQLFSSPTEEPGFAASSVPTSRSRVALKVRTKFIEGEMESAHSRHRTPSRAEIWL